MGSGCFWIGVGGGHARGRCRKKVVCLCIKKSDVNKNVPRKNVGFICVVEGVGECSEKRFALHSIHYRPLRSSQHFPD